MTSTFSMCHFIIAMKISKYHFSVTWHYISRYNILSDMKAIFRFPKIYQTGIFLENDFWTSPPLLSILYMGLTGSVLT